MGSCIYYPFMGTLDKQNALASLRTWNLTQDNSGPYRVYRDGDDNIYHSVTHILKETAPQHTKDALENWLKRSDSALERDIACERGKLAHSHAEFILKLAAKFAENYDFTNKHLTPLIKLHYRIYPDCRRRIRWEYKDDLVALEELDTVDEQIKKREELRLKNS